MQSNTALRLKQIYSTRDTVLLEYLRSVLAERGIAVFVRNPTNTGLAVGELTPAVTSPELWVGSDEDVAAAERLVKTTLEDMRPVSTEPWVCPKCGEHLEPQFEVCWSCGHPRDL